MSKENNAIALKEAMFSYFLNCNFCKINFSFAFILSLLPYRLCKQFQCKWKTCLFIFGEFKLERIVKILLKLHILAASK